MASQKRGKVTTRSDQPGVQGSVEFLTSRQELLNEYDLARRKAENKRVKVDHGVVGEAVIRRWLESFLPKRFGVTSGFIISQGQNAAEELVHFDVIVYDQLESPVLWVETSPDRSNQGTSRGIPAEYVVFVMEVKSQFSTKTVNESISQIQKLNSILRDTDSVGERYKRNLPETFGWCILCFELGTSNANSLRPLEALIAAKKLRGFYGCIILRGEERGEEETARITILRSQEGELNKIQLVRHLNPDRGLLGTISNTGWIGELQTGQLGALLHWSESNFALFSHDVVAICKGNYDPDYFSSLHGIRWRIKFKD